MTFPQHVYRGQSRARSYFMPRAERGLLLSLDASACARPAVIREKARLARKGSSLWGRVPRSETVPCVSPVEGRGRWPCSAFFFPSSLRMKHAERPPTLRVGAAAHSGLRSPRGSTGWQSSVPLSPRCRGGAAARSSERFGCGPSCSCTNLIDRICIESMCRHTKTAALSWGRGYPTEEGG